MIQKATLIAALAATLLLAASPKAEEARKLVKEGKYDEAVALLEAERKKSPKEADLKAGIIEAHLAAGDFHQYRANEPPRVKYPTALRHYRQVLLVDSANAKAKKEIAQIEGIYQSMGRPVPQ